MYLLGGVSDIDKNILMWHWLVNFDVQLSKNMKINISRYFSVRSVYSVMGKSIRYFIHRFEPASRPV